MRSLVIAAAAALAAATGELAWQQSLQYSVYTSAGVARHAGAPATFSVATWLNPPVYVESFSSADNSSATWAFQAQSSQSTFFVDTARHSEALGVGAVDTAVSETFTDADGYPGAALYGFASTGAAANGAPVWNITLKQAWTYTLDDQTVFTDMSDDGSLVAFAGSANQTISGHVVEVPFVWGVDGQTGRVLFRFSPGANLQPAPASVSTSATGAWIAYCYGAAVFILDGSSGAVRANLTLSYAVPPAVSDDGSMLVAGSPDSLDIWRWNATSGTYVQVHALTPPAGVWYPTDFHFSEGVFGTPGAAEGHALVAATWEDGEAMTVLATIWNATSGALEASWRSPTNTKLQNQAIVRMDGSLGAFACWGDQDNAPTVVVLQAGVDAPIFNATTPGSMFAVDIAIEQPTDHGVAAWLVAAGKAVPANVMGNGGMAYGWRITAPTA